MANHLKVKGQIIPAVTTIRQYRTARAINSLPQSITALVVAADILQKTLDVKILLGCTGGVISAFIVVMAIYMIRQSSKKLKELKYQKVPNGK